ncbi:MAG: ABC transporter ATP-binding protein [Nitrososphaerales archaeon]
MSEPLLEVSDVEVHFGAIPALRNARLRVHESEIVAVVGANGGGKTTLLRAIAGLEPLSQGRITLAGRDITRLPTELRVGLGVSMVPQGRRMFAESTVETNLWAGAFRRRDRKAVAADMEKYYDFFPALGERRDLPAGNLSGGQQQMLATARALMSRPRVLLLDEPSMGLSPIIVGQIFTSLSELSREGLTMVLVEQNVARALEIADRVYVLVAGEMVGEDRPASEVNLDDLVASFLGVATDGTKA